VENQVLKYYTEHSIVLDVRLAYAPNNTHARINLLLDSEGQINTD